MWRRREFLRDGDSLSHPKPPSHRMTSIPYLSGRERQQVIPFSRRTAVTFLPSQGRTRGVFPSSVYPFFVRPSLGGSACAAPPQMPREAAEAPGNLGTSELQGHLSRDGDILSRLKTLSHRMTSGPYLSLGGRGHSFGMCRPINLSPVTPPGMDRASLPRKLSGGDQEGSFNP